MAIDDYTFDSQAEGAYYLRCKSQGWAYKVHPKYELMPGFRMNGKAYRGAAYTPDFAIYDEHTRTLKSVVDVKGGNVTLTPDARLRMKLFMQHYQVPVIIARYDYKTKQFEEKQL